MGLGTHVDCRGFTTAGKPGHFRRRAAYFIFRRSAIDYSDIYTSDMLGCNPKLRTLERLAQW